MNEPCGWSESFEEVESVVRAAGDYVRPSRDLRPRVLEASRLDSHERRARWRIARLALLAVVFAFFTVSGIEQVQTPELRPPMLMASASHALSPLGARGGDSDWTLVEAFTELRRRQADVLRL